MKRDPETEAANFFAFARDYLHSYMPKARRLSPKTIEAYRISLECFLTYLADCAHVERAHVSFDHFDRKNLKAWTAWMADDRHYATRTVSLRLTAVKAFLAYCSHEDITLVALSPRSPSNISPKAKPEQS
jgi:site-specific recombinase XerD